jgi:hypothetical protein
VSDRLGPAARAALDEALAAVGGAAVAPFAAAVVWQAAHPLGTTGAWADGADDDPDAAERRELDAARQLGALLGVAARRGAQPPDAFDRAAIELARDVALLSACYQNLDLLPASAAGDAVAMLVARALEGLDAHHPP